MQAAGRATGISPWRIRTWERRYGVPSPERSANGRRLYSDDDLAVLRRMAALVAQGIPARQAAEAIRDEGVLAGNVPPDAPPDDPRIARLADAARRFDEAGCDEAITDAVRDAGWAAALDHVVMPALRLIGELWDRGTVSVAEEHFLSHVVQRRLFTAVSALPAAQPKAPRLLVACPADEYHEMGALALWLLLREQGAHVIYLGADVPPDALVSAVQRLVPNVVCLSAVAPNSAPMLTEAARRLLEARVSARVFVGGPALLATGGEPVPAPRLPVLLSASVDVLLRAAR